MRSSTPAACCVSVQDRMDKRMLRQSVHDGNGPSQRSSLQCPFDYGLSNESVSFPLADDRNKVITVIT